MATVLGFTHEISMILRLGSFLPIAELLISKVDPSFDCESEFPVPISVPDLNNVNVLQIEMDI